MFFVSPRGSRHLGEMKTSAMMKTNDHQGNIKKLHSNRNEIIPFSKENIYK